MAIPPQIRAILSVLTGIALGFSVMLLIQSLSPYQPPAGVSIETGAGFNRWVSSLPTDGYLSFLWSFLAGGFVGGAITGFIARKTRYVIAPLVTGFVLLILAIGGFLAFNHPEWLTYASCIGFMVSSALGGWLTRKIR